MSSKKVKFTLFFCLLFIWQPVIAEDPDLQATVQKMQDLLQQQQKQLDEQRQELAAQRLLIKQLQGSTGAEQTTAAIPDVVYPDAETTDTMVQKAESDTPIPSEDQSGQQKAVLALATKQATGPQTDEQKEQDQDAIAKKTF